MPSTPSPKSPGEHRPEQLSDGPAAFSSHATVFIPQPRTDVRAHHCADPYRWSDLSRCIGPFLRCDGEEQDHIHSHFWSARLVPCGSRAVDSQRARMDRTAAHRANHRAEPAHVACDATSRPRDFAMRVGSLEAEQLSGCSSLRPDADGSSHVRGCSSLCDGQASAMHAEATRSLRTGCASTRVPAA